MHCRNCVSIFDRVLGREPRDSSTRDCSLQSHAAAEGDGALGLSTPRTHGPVLDSAVLIVLSPPDTCKTSLAREIRAALPKTLATVAGYEVERLVFDPNTPLKGREVLAVGARSKTISDLAEDSGLPKPQKVTATKTLWKHFKTKNVSKFIGSEDIETFFSESEVLYLLVNGIYSAPTPILRYSSEIDDVHAAVLPAAEGVGVVESVFALHNPERVARLMKGWKPYLPYKSLPVEEWAEYFGPFAVQYFVFMQEYARWLVAPSIIGFLVFVCREWLQSDWSPKYHQAYALFLAIWSTLFLEHWKRMLAVTRYQLGQNKVDHESMTLEPSGVMDKGMFHAVADEYQKPHEPEHEPEDGPTRSTGIQEQLYTVRYVWSISAVVVLLGVTCVIIHLLLWLGDVVEKKYDNIIIQNAPLILYLGVVGLLQKVYDRLVVWLTHKEHHAVYTEFMKSLTVKAAMFQLVNYHGWFLYIAFWQQDMQYLRSQLLIFFTLKQVFGNVVEVVLPFLQERSKKCCRRRATMTTPAQGTKACRFSEVVNGNPAARQALKQSIEEQWELTDPALFDDYLEMAVMFAAVVGYSSVFPFGSLLALAHSLMEATSDAYKLCEVQRRLLPRHIDSVMLEAWVGIFDAIGILGVVCSAALIGVAYPGDWSVVQLVVVEHCMLFFKGYLAWSIPDQPEWITAEELRLEHHLKMKNRNQGMSLRRQHTYNNMGTVVLDHRSSMSHHLRGQHSMVNE